VVAFGWGLSLGERRRLQEAGAHGYVSVGVGALELVELLEGLAHLPGTAHPTPSAATAIPLSGREAEIMALITRGLTNQEIAGELFLSINTVKTYIRGAYQKVGVARRAQAVAWGIENGLAPVNHRYPRPARSRSPL
jgi:DNA-binding NarL/FixJ family response regulator